MSTSTARSLVKNTAVMMAAQAATWVSGFLLMIFLPRCLGNEGYGRLFLAMSVQMICQWFIDYGGQNYIAKEVSRDRSNVSALMTHSAILRIGLWLISLIATYLFSLAAGYSREVILLVMILCASNLWTSLTVLLRNCYQGFEAMQYPSIASVAERSFLLLAAIPALLLGAKEIVVAFLMAAAALVSFGISLRYAKKFFAFKVSFDASSLRQLAREGFPYFLWSVFGVIYYRIDTVMLSMMTTEAVVGWYGAAYRFFDILMFLPAIYSQALYPILTKLSTNEERSMKSVSQKSLGLLVLAGIPIAVLLLFFSRTVIQILFGLGEFGPSVELLQIFSVGILLVYADFVLGGTVLALDRQKAWAAIAGVAALVNIGLNSVLIPHFQSATGNGGIGAAIATDLTELFVMLGAIRLLPKGHFTRTVVMTLAKGAFSGVVMAGFIAAGRFLAVPWPALSVSAVLVYVASLVLMRTPGVPEIVEAAGAAFPGGLRRTLSQWRSSRA